MNQVEDTERAVYPEIGMDELADVLETTIKKDKVNKLTAFLCCLSAYTDDSQFNITFSAPSSTGKSYIPMEISKYFPNEDVLELGYCSPASFYHDHSEDTNDKGEHIVDLSNKIIIFLDQPHHDLTARLRPLLSHDKKEILVKISDKNKNSANRSKNIKILGYPAVIFCSAALRIDEQETTRFLLLSPEVDNEKIDMSIQQTISKETDREKFIAELKSNPTRILLSERIKAIKAEEIKTINLPDTDLIYKKFQSQIGERRKPRHQRDIKTLIHLVKASALLNCWHRNLNNHVITATEQDIENAFEIWREIYISQELGVTPIVLAMYKNVMVPLWNKKRNAREKVGFTRAEFLSEYYDIEGKRMNEDYFRTQILPMLKSAGLINEEKDTETKRLLITPTDDQEVFQYEADQHMALAIEHGLIEGEIKGGQSEEIASLF